MSSPRGAGHKLENRRIPGTWRGKSNEFPIFMKRRCVLMKKLFQAVGKAIAESCEAYYYTYIA